MDKKALQKQRDTYKNMGMNELIELRESNNIVRINKLREKYLPERCNQYLKYEGNGKDE